MSRFSGRIKGAVVVRGTDSGIYGLASTVEVPTNTGFSGTLGLTSSLYSVSGQVASFSSGSANISAYAGATVRPVFRHIVGTAGTAYQADLQLDDITIGGNNYSFESNATGWQTNLADTGVAYTSVSWSDIPLLPASTAGRWNRYGGNTPSSGTGNLTAADGQYFLYTETSSPVVETDVFWLRGPEIVLPANPTFTFYEGRQGAAIGSFDVYLDVIS